MRPGGVVLVVDFSPHDLVELQREHAHVHLGFADNQVQGWLRSAGLNPLEPIHFPGRRLMTGIWRGEPRAAGHTVRASRRLLTLPSQERPMSPDTGPLSAAAPAGEFPAREPSAAERLVRVLPAEDRGDGAAAVGGDRAARAARARPSSR